MTTTVYSGDYYDQIQKRQADVSKQTLYHGAETNGVTSVAEANINSFETSRQLEQFSTSSSATQKVDQFYDCYYRKI